MLRPRADGAEKTRTHRRSHILLGGHALKPLPAGALHWQAESTLIVADLHLEKGAVFAARGMLLPPYDTSSSLRRLGRLIEGLRPRRVVALGDSFHTSQSAERLNHGDRETLLKLQDGREWYWVLGNHDPTLPRDLGSVVCSTLAMDGITLRHEPSNDVSPEIAGHLHPVARLSRRGQAIRRKCFATNGDRVVMPAFGAYAGGLNVLDKAFGPLFARRQFEAWMMGRRDVYAVRSSALLPD